MASFLARVVVLLVSEEGKWFADWSVVRSQTSHRHVCLMGKCVFKGMLLTVYPRGNAAAEPHGRHI